MRELQETISGYDLPCCENLNSRPSRNPSATTCGQSLLSIRPYVLWKIEHPFHLKHSQGFLLVLLIGYVTSCRSDTH